MYRARGPAGPVALKLLLDQDPRWVRRFQLEGAVLLRANHPNVLHGFEVGQDRGRPFLAMELIEGEDLARRVGREGVPAEASVRTWLLGVAAGLDHCHRLGLVHRDLKPANVLLERMTQRPVLVDFGLVHRDPVEFGPLSIDRYSQLSATGEIHGTPSYMAPEQASSEFGAVGPLTDVYALGGLLYFLLTGQAPYRQSNLIEVLSRLVDQRLPSPDPAKLAPHASQDLLELCRACLQKDPLLRPRGAADVASRLARRGTSPSAPRSRAWLAGAAGVFAVAAAGAWAARPGAPSADAPVAQLDSPPSPEPTRADEAAAQASREFDRLYDAAVAHELAREPKRTQALLEEALPLIPAPDYRRGLALLKLDRLDECLAEAQAAASASPQDALPVWLCGEVERRLKHPDRALTLLRKAIDLDPDCLLAWRSKAEIHVRRHEFEGIETAMSRCLELGDTSLFVFNQVALAQHSLGRIQESEQSIDALEAAHPADAVEIGHFRARLRRGRKDFHGAQVELDRLLKIAPEDSATRIERGSLFLALGEPAAALKEAEHALHLNKNAFSVAELIGRCQLALRAFGSADEWLSRAASEAPSRELFERVTIFRVLNLLHNRDDRDSARSTLEALLTKRYTTVWPRVWYLALGGTFSPESLERSSAEMELTPWQDALLRGLTQPLDTGLEAALAAARSADHRTQTYAFFALRQESQGALPAVSQALYAKALAEGASNSVAYEWTVARTGAAPEAR